MNMKRIVISILVAVGITAGLGLVTPSANAASPAGRDCQWLSFNPPTDSFSPPAIKDPCKKGKGWSSLVRKDWERAHFYLPIGKRELRYFEPLSKGRAYVEFNTGAAGVLKPCRTKGSERCYYSGKGRKFVRVWHHTFYL